MFIGPYEHHSNELPWRESIADVVVIDEDADGHIDLAELERRLVALRRPAAAHRQLLRGLQRHRHLDRRRPVAALLHEHGALSFWDYAAAGPYVPIRMAESARARRPQGRHLLVTAQVRRRAPNPRRPGRPPGTGAQPASSEAAARHGQAAVSR